MAPLEVEIFDERRVPKSKVIISQAAAPHYVISEGTEDSGQQEIFIFTCSPLNSYSAIYRLPVGIDITANNISEITPFDFDRESELVATLNEKNPKFELKVKKRNEEGELIDRTIVFTHIPSTNK